MSGEDGRDESVSVDDFMSNALELSEPRSERAVDYYRIGEICPPFSKSWVVRKLHAGDLRAVRVGGVVLITGQSLRQLLQSSTTWEPPK